MSSKGQLLQDPFLNTLRKEHVPVSIYLVNGIKLQGQIESFDQYVVLLKNSVTQMVYKHAISTVVPSRPISLEPDRGRVAPPACPKPQPSFPAGPPIRPPRSSCAWISAIAGHEEGSAEVVRLAESAGALRTAVVGGRRARPDPKLYAGSGKVAEIGRAADALNAATVIFNHALSPGQQRNLEKALGRTVLDRTELILQIFAQRAQTSEGKLQVELAQLRAPVDAPGARLDAPRAPARRPRQDRRPGRKADRARPARTSRSGSRC